MGLLGLSPHEINPCELRPGDHIYTDRNMKTYNHHCIYIGYGRVIHFTKVSSHRPAIKEERCCHYLDTTTDGASGVRMCCLHCFLQGHSLYRFDYGDHFWAVVRVTRSASNCDDVDTVVWRALELLKHNNFGEYCLYANNCETFAYFCKTGVKYLFGSKQVLRAGILAASGGIML